MQKKAQITLFLILGFVLLLGFSFIVYLRAQENPKLQIESEKISKLSADMSPVKVFVDSCIESVGKDALITIGKNGGYFELPSQSTKDYDIKTAYYFYESIDIMPPKSRVEQELSKYMNNELFFCLKNLTDFEKIGMKIEQGNINTITTITPRNVLFSVDLPLTIRQEESESRFSKFDKNINVKLQEIYDVSAKITEKQAIEPDFLPISHIIGLANKNNLSIFINNLNNDSLLLTIVDNEIKINDLPYRFRFANKYKRYSCSNVPFGEDEFSKQFLLDCVGAKIKEFNYSLNIAKITDLQAEVNQPFAYKVDALGIGLSYSDYTELFDINSETGVINFIPKIEDIGIHLITIEVKDKLNNSDYNTFRLNISES